MANSTQVEDRSRNPRKVHLHRRQPAKIGSGTAWTLPAWQTTRWSPGAI